MGVVLPSGVEDWREALVVVPVGVGDHRGVELVTSPAAPEPLEQERQHVVVFASVDDHDALSVIVLGGDEHRAVTLADVDEDDSRGRSVVVSSSGMNRVSALFECGAQETSNQPLTAGPSIWRKSPHSTCRTFAPPGASRGWTSRPSRNAT